MRPEDGDAIAELLEEWLLTHDKPPAGMLAVLRRAGYGLTTPEPPASGYACGAAEDDLLLDYAMAGMCCCNDCAPEGLL